MTPLDRLLSSVSDAARTLPGAVEMYIFGSAANQSTRDEFSDLDLQILTENFAISRKAFPNFLALAGKVELIYPLLDRPGDTAFSIGFAGESLYHKVDIGLSGRQESGFFNQIKDKVLLWQQPAQTATISLPPLTAYCPGLGTPSHFLIGEMISAVRYAKARQRGRHLTCWRFLSAKVGAYLRCFQWNRDPRIFPQTSLNTWDYALLDDLLPEEDRLRLLGGIQTGSPTEMDRSLIGLTGEIAAKVLPEIQDEQVEGLVKRFLCFLQTELEDSLDRLSP